MAKQSLLTMVSQACAEMGLAKPISVSDPNNAIALQLLALANREGRETARRAGPTSGWPALTYPYTFTVQSTGIIPNCSFTLGSNIITIGTPPTQAPQVGWVLSTSAGSNATGFSYPTTVLSVNGSQITVSSTAGLTNTSTSMAFGQESYALPADYDYMIPNTFWDRGTRWQVLGPMQPAEWQVLKSGLSPIGPRRRFRIYEGKIFLDPIPYDSNTLVFEYVSGNFVTQSSGATSSTFSSDLDTYILSDETLILGMIWRFRRSKGLDYDQEFQTYENLINSEMGRAPGNRIVSLTDAGSGLPFLGMQNIPDTGFGR